LRYAVDQVPRGQRRVLLERIDSQAHVLDIGCWAGATGRFLAERGVTVDGVEPEPEMAALAAKSYGEVTCAHIEEVLSTFTVERRASYDAVLLLDVLEHLPDPWWVFAQCGELLREEGRAYVSLPNVAHWTVRKDVLLGRWEYRESGLLDRTHLRFFTRRSARAFLEECGWQIAWEGVDVDQPPLVRLPERWLSALHLWPSLFAVQCLFEVIPSN
jgi:2-polyprenyl-3-methyl-5-hydroxy-6-metoxy-1,4-benzoquinol methylase